MKAIVLVGGLGTRLRPLTLETPKQLLPIVDRPMLEWVVAGLARHGVDEVVLSIGYRPDAFHDAYPDGCCAGVPLRYAVEPEPLDTAGAIRFAARDAAINERFIVVNGDVLTDLDVGALVAFHNERGAEATIALHKVDDPSRYGVVPTDEEGRVIAFVEKPAPGEAPTDLINAGTYVVEPSVIDRIAAGRRVSIERVTFPEMVRDGRLFARGDGGVYWLDTGTATAYIQAQVDIIEGRRPALEALGFAALAVDPSAELNGASVQSSIVRDGACIGDDAVLERAIVLSGATVGPGARIVDSVVGPGAEIGAGAVLEAGTLIGRGERVAPGAHLHGARVPGGALMRTLVTGGAGFIGSTLVDRLLAEGHSVDVIDDLSNGNLANLAEARSDRRNEVTFHQLDIREPSTVDLVARRRPDVVFHLAAQADVRVSVARPAYDAGINVVGSLNVIEGALAAGARKVVFASSGGTLYGDTDPAALPVKESHPRQPVSPYGVAKMAVGDYLHAFRTLHDLEYAALALANVYGPRQDPHGEAGVVAIFAGRLLAGQPCTVYGDGEQTRDFVFVDDVVDAFVRAADKGSGLLCNIGTGRETSVNHLYATMASAVGIDAPAVRAPERAGELRRSCLDPGRAGIHLGWKAWTSLEDGVAATLRWFADRAS